MIIDNIYMYIYICVPYRLYSILAAFPTWHPLRLTSGKVFETLGHWGGLAIC